MSLERAPLEHDTNATSASWYAPLAMFVTWLANLFAHITKLKRIRRTTTFKPNWADHWDGLRNSEWRRDQLITQCTAHVLAGGSLEDDKPVDILPDPPAGYGGPCPRTPFEMNRRFLYLARFLADPSFFIRRHIARIAKRERIDLTLPIDPLRRAARATSPGSAEGGKAPAPLASLSRLATGGGGMRVLHAHDGGGLSTARGPPTLPKSPTTHLAATCEIAPSCPKQKGRPIGAAFSYSAG